MARGPELAPGVRPALRLPASDPLFGRHRPRHARHLGELALRKPRAAPAALAGNAVIWAEVGRQSTAGRRPLLLERHGDEIYRHAMSVAQNRPTIPH
jgi:hypothetical protein